MKSAEDGIQVVESSFLHGGKWSLAKRGTLGAALDAFLPFRNTPYKAQLAARSKELDQTLDDILKRSEDAFAGDKKYAKKPSIRKPPLEDIIPMIPNVGYETNVTLGLENDAKGKIRAGIRVIYVKNGVNYRFLLPLSECSNVAPQIVKAAEATAVFLTQQKFDVSDGVKHRGDMLGLKFTMNKIGEIIMTLVLVIDPDAPPNEESDVVDEEKVENKIFYAPGGLKKQLREFFFKSNVTCQIKEHLEKYTPALKKFVEDNRARLGVVGVYITWHDAESSTAGLKPDVRPWYHVAGDETLTETINSVKIDFSPHLENTHPSRTQAIAAIVNTIVDGLSLSMQNALVLLLSEFYFTANLISQKFKKTAVLEELQIPLQSYLKEKRKHDIIFVSSSKTNWMRLRDRTPEAVIHWGLLKDDEIIKRILSLNLAKRPRKIAWVIDTREDNHDSDGNICSNADLLERNHMKLYPFYTLDRVVGIDVAPQRGEQLTLVAFYKRCDEDLRANHELLSQIRDNTKSGPKAESKVPNQQVPGGPNHKRKAPDQQGQDPNSNKTSPNQRGPKEERRDGAQKGSVRERSNATSAPIGAKRPRRSGSPQIGSRGPSRHTYLRARGPPGELPQNPWANNSCFDRRILTPNQTASGVMSQLKNVIGKQLLLAQMNTVLQLTSSSNTVDDMGLDRGADGDHGVHDWAPRGNDDFPPPPRQFPTWKPWRAPGEDVAPENFRSNAREDFARVDSRSSVREDIDHEGFRSTSREDVPQGNYGSSARQELTSDDFWNTPLEDLTRNKFSGSPIEEKISSSSTSREAVASMSTSRGEFPQDNYYSSSRQEFSRSNVFRSADREEFRGASPTWRHRAVRGMSHDNENHTPSNFGSKAQDDFVRSDIERSAQNDVISEDLRRTTRGSSTREYTRWAAQDESTRKEFGSAWGSGWEDSGMLSPDATARRHLRSLTQEDSRNALSRDFSYDHLGSTAKEKITHDDYYKKVPRANSTHTNVRRAPWEESRRASGGDLPHQDFRSAVRRDFPYDNSRGTTKGEISHRNDYKKAGSAHSHSGRAPWEEARTASGNDFSLKNSGGGTAREFTSDYSRRTAREDITHLDDNWKAAREDSTHTDVRCAPWEDARSASQKGFYREDSKRTIGGNFNGASRDNSINTTGQGVFNVEPRGTPQENLSRHEFFGSHRSYGSGEARYSFDGTSRNSIGGEKFGFSSRNTGDHIDGRDIHSASSGRFGLDQNAWGDITRRNY